MITSIEEKIWQIPAPLAQAIHYISVEHYGVLLNFDMNILIDYDLIFFYLICFNLSFLFNTDPFVFFVACILLSRLIVKAKSRIMCLYFFHVVL